MEYCFERIVEIIRKEVSVNDVLRDAGIHPNIQINNHIYYCCPFHDEKIDRSLKVNVEKQVFFCFVCGSGGDIISLTCKLNNSSARDAADYLVQQFFVSEYGKARRQAVIKGLAEAASSKAASLYPSSKSQ